MYQPKHNKTRNKLKRYIYNNSKILWYTIALVVRIFFDEKNILNEIFLTSSVKK